MNNVAMFPTIWLNWETSKDKFYLNCATNEKQNFRPAVNFGWRYRNEQLLYSAGTYILCAYAKYHKEIDRLEIAACTIDSTRTAKTREWKYAGNRYFIDKNKNVYDEYGNPVLCNYQISKRHYCYDFKNLLQMYGRLNYTDAVVKEFHKFLGATYFTNGTGKQIEAKYLWHIHEWYVRKQRTATGKGKEQQLTDELTAIPLTPVSELSSKYLVVEQSVYGSYYTKQNGILYFERVNDDWSVVRVLVPRHYGTADIRLCETERFYINDNGKNRIVAPAKNGWIPARQVQDWYNHTFVNAEEAAEKCKRIKYILPLFKEDEKKIKRCLFNALKFPEIEHLAKLGHTDVAYRIASRYTPKADIKSFFGYYNEKEKNLLRKIGMTKHQLDKHLARNEGRTYYYGSTELIKLMREYFGDDFIHLDNATFDKYYDAFEQILYRCGGTRFTNTFNRINVDQKKFIKNMVRIGSKNTQAYVMICDAVNCYLRLEMLRRPEVNWFFDSYSDVVRTHDALMEIQLVQDAERRAYYNMAEAERRKKDEEKRIKMDKERKQYEYEDDNFIIRLPKDGNEITKEGLTQHICIGNYVSRHSNAETNLFFLRKKSEPDKPFYAIEMNNDKVINQIHGFGNRWLGNNPDAIPTVIRWLRKNGIKCSDHILTCKATGYGSTNSHVPMPVVD